MLAILVLIYPFNKMYQIEKHLKSTCNIVNHKKRVPYYKCKKSGHAYN